MDFLRSFFLWGLLGIAAPIIVHLLGQRKRRVIPIATLRFLERARVKASAHLKLRRLLLLLARISILAALAILYAGPGCRTKAGREGPTSWALILDASPSMAAVRGGVSALDKAKDALLKALDRAGVEDKFIFTTSLHFDGKSHAAGFTADVGSVRRAAANAGVEHGRHDLAAALESVAALASSGEGMKILLATDLQANGWQKDKIALNDSVDLTIIDVGFDSPSNSWIEKVEQDKNGFTVNLHSMGLESEERKTVKMVLGDGAPLTAFVKGASAAFQIKTAVGMESGVASVAPGGDLALDDQLDFIFKGRSKLRVLVVNGDPKGFEIRDETLFIRRALAHDAGLGELFDLSEVRQGALTAAHIASADVVFMANPGAMPVEMQSALLERLESGAGLIVAAGDMWNSERDGQDFMAQLLAAPFRDVVSIRGDDATRRPFQAIDLNSFAGPMIELRDEHGADFSGLKVTKYWVLDVRPGQDVGVLMRLDNGVPLLVERTVGKGRTMLLATTVDRDGANLCLQPAFIPWLRSMLLYSSGKPAGLFSGWAVAGKPIAFPHGRAVDVQSVDGKITQVEAGGSFVPELPGIYRVLSDGIPIDLLAARTDPAESDLAKLKPGALDSIFGEGRYAIGSGEARGAAATVRGRSDVSNVFAAILLAALLLEAILSGRWSSLFKRKSFRPDLSGPDSRL